MVANTIEVSSLSDRPNLVDGSIGGIGWAYSNGVITAPILTPKADSALAKDARAKRNMLITATDYYALTDVTMTQEMTAYRQALRNVPEQDGFPSDISWPEKPE
ncbi:MAG: hypothetical protein GY918_14905 [Gammaproteobacteria bacterium]|nr:hypothetical protein [Gammaproteobacteria bacterium]